MTSGSHVDYWVEVKYRNSDTKWRWRRRWIQKKRRKSPRTECEMPKPGQNKCPKMKSALLVSAKVDLFVCEVLGQSPRSYLHPSILPITDPDPCSKQPEYPVWSRQCPSQFVQQKLCTGIGFCILNWWIVLHELCCILPLMCTNENENKVYMYTYAWSGAYLAGDPLDLKTRAVRQIRFAGQSNGGFSPHLYV